MSRSFSRDELLQALRAVEAFLKGFPNMQFPAGEESTPAPEPVGMLATHAATPPVDGSIIGPAYGKGVPQPARKRHSLNPKVKLERVDWSGIPRAARRIAEELTRGPATSHELMARLQIARPTFNNAISKLRRRKIVMAEDIRSGSIRVRSTAEARV